MQMDLFIELRDDNNMIFKTNKLLFYGDRMSSFRVIDIQLDNFRVVEIAKSNYQFSQ